MAVDDKEMYLGAIACLAAAIDVRDPYTRAHSERVSQHSKKMARVLGLSEHEIEVVTLSALMHDVGKLGIDDQILRKAGPLTDEEFEIIKTHPAKGAAIMEPFPPLREVIPGVKYHHENLDGTGYPDGLRGDKIPFTAKIIAVAETFDAMTTTSPYQKAREVPYVLERLRSFVGSKFDKKIVEALIRSLEV